MIKCQPWTKVRLPTGVSCVVGPWNRVLDPESRNSKDRALVYYYNLDQQYMYIKKVPGDILEELYRVPGDILQELNKVPGDILEDSIRYLVISLRTQ